MKFILRKQKIDYRFLILLLNVIVLVSSQRLNPLIIGLISILVWIVFYISNKQYEKSNVILARMLILSIPLSFTNIFGEPYGDSILSWYNIFLLLLVMSVFLNVLQKRFYLNFISLFSAFIIIIGLIPAILSEDIFDSLKQYINLASNFILVIVGNNIALKHGENQKNKFISDYIFATKIAAIGVIIQMCYISLLKINIGYYKFLGGYRHSYGFLFSDFSFLSLFIVSGAILIWFQKGIHVFKLKNLIEILFLLFSSIMTSARTGIFSFIFVVLLFSLIKSLKYLSRGSIRSIALILVNMLIILGSYTLLDKVRGTAKFSDSGRMALNRKAFNIFLKKPLTGVGFGGGNFAEISGTITHNILLQYLAQGGLILAIPLFLFLFLILYTTFKKDRVIFAGMLCLIIGSFFIPNIFNSRFMGAMLMIMNIRLSIRNNSILINTKEMII